MPAEMGPSADQAVSTGARSRWRRWRVAPVLAGGLALVLGALSLLGLRVLGVWPPDPDPAQEATGGPGTAAPASPFAGTPAAGFAEGAAGIVLPPAEPVGDFTAADVAEALALVRQALVAARLDRTMLVDHDPASFIALVATAQQPPLQEAFDSGTFATFATQIAGDAVPTTAAPRVAGQISYQAATAERDLPVLEVITSFVWAYSFEVTGGEHSAPIVVVRDQLEWQMLQADAFLEPSRGLWLSGGESGAWGMDCDAYQQGLIRPGDAADPGDEVAAAFDLEQPLPSGNGC